MTTRSNLYKNPSLAYKKDLSLSSVLQNLKAYNIATGNASRIEEQPQAEERRASVKRHRISESLPDRNTEIEENDGPMSHQDYIDKRRKEVSSTHSYEQLAADVLGTSNSVINLVGYESDESLSAECEERVDPPNAGEICDVETIKNRSEQRYPFAGEPVCVMCGKYGEYICNETDDDICSLDCKTKLLKSLKIPEVSSSNQNPNVSPSTCHEKDFWDYNHNRWSKKISSLCTYECWKCKRPGHLADDCLVMTSCKESMGQNKSSSISRDLLELYRRCHQIGKSVSIANCSACRGFLNLSTCLDCNAVLCYKASE